MSGFSFPPGIFTTAHHNAVFVGRDEDGYHYAHQRGTAGNFRLDVKATTKPLLLSGRGRKIVCL
ncbi:MAG: DUF3991 domain-containing protein [Eubacterium sp.]